jgi:hypothetical protein
LVLDLEKTGAEMELFLLKKLGCKSFMSVLQESWAKNNIKVDTYER